VLQKALEAGYRTRVSVRKESQLETLKSHKLIKDYAAKGLVEGVVVPDIVIDGAFDEALKDVVAVLHIASPLGRPVTALLPSYLERILTLIERR
jgi:uncharacterized protein YbjT (DUF2867 family)